MKVLLCERNLEGHRLKYVEELSRINGLDVYIYAPKFANKTNTCFYEYTLKNKKNLLSYLSWIRTLKRIVKENKIDVVHILDGDSIMRWFGLGLKHLGLERTVITFHHYFSGFSRKLSYKCMSAGRDKVFVVHTDEIRNRFLKANVRNVVKCDYPAFSFEKLNNLQRADCKSQFNLSKTLPVIGIIGGIANYKNILRFLSILVEIEIPFQILIAGKPVDIEKEKILNITGRIKNKVKVILRPLTDEEYFEAICASDIIYSLYGKDFDGASGPLTDGVCANKMILACNHGSLGEIVQSNHLGITAKCDDNKDILLRTKKAIESFECFRYDEVALNYREKLSPSYFKRTYYAIYTHGEFIYDS